MKSLSDRARAAHEIVESIEELRDVKAAIERIRDALGLSHVAYHATSVPTLTERGPYIATTYDPLWVRRYIDENYQSLDPVVLASLRGFIPIDWRLLDFGSRQRVEFMMEAKEFDISANGMTIPIRGPAGEHALFSINASSDETCWDTYIEESKGELHLVAHFLHNRIRTVEGLDESSQRIKLSPREVDVLYWLARGKTFEDVADILAIASRTVRAHVESARYKLNATNSVNAIAKALSAGLIAPVSTR